MELATIEMDPELADAKFQEYRAAVRERHDDEDARIMRGYQALRRGQRLIRLSTTMQAGGYTTRNAGRGVLGTQRYALPKLAIAHAEEKAVHIEGIERDGSLVFYWNSNRNRFATRRNIYVPAGTFRLRDSESISTTSWSRNWWDAMVPPVPPGLRPKRGLAGYLVLWEADWRWQGALRAPGDPALLKRVGGDLYAVVAQWDLTELERAVLEEGR